MPVVPSQVQDSALLLAEPHEALVSLFLQVVQVPINGNAVHWYSHLSSPFYVICRLHEGMLPITLVINEELNSIMSL